MGGSRGGKGRKLADRVLPLEMVHRGLAMVHGCSGVAKMEVVPVKNLWTVATMEMAKLMSATRTLRSLC